MEGNRKMTIETPVRPTGLDSVEEALAALAEIVRGQEDFVYESARYGGCMNMDPEKKCGRCLVGTLLLAHGVPPELFLMSVHPVETSGATANTAGIDELVDEGLIALPALVVSVLSAAQDSQDQAHTWGQALAQARSHAEFELGVTA
jgi:hypothetical protein